MSALNRSLRPCSTKTSQMPQPTWRMSLAVNPHTLTFWHSSSSHRSYRLTRLISLRTWYHHLNWPFHQLKRSLSTSAIATSKSKRGKLRVCPNDTYLPKCYKNSSSTALSRYLKRREAKVQRETSSCLIATSVPTPTIAPSMTSWNRAHQQLRS